MSLVEAIIGALPKPVQTYLNAIVEEQQSSLHEFVLRAVVEHGAEIMSGNFSFVRSAIIKEVKRLIMSNVLATNQKNFDAEELGNEIMSLSDQPEDYRLPHYVDYKADE